MQIDMTDQVVMVTGGNDGIGEAACHAFAEVGAKVGVLGRDRKDVRLVVDKIRDTGGEAMPLIADITKPAAMQKAVESLVGKYGRLDTVFANAGINGVWAPITDLTPEEWNQTITTNLTGTFLTIRYAVPYMQKRGGSIVVTASVNGTRMFSNIGASAYASSKAAQVALTKMLALELAHDKIRVNVICPGAVETDIEGKTVKRNLERFESKVRFQDGEIPLTGGKPATSAQVADLVVFLSSPYASHITGTELWIDGAESLIVG